jgi:DNA polymerase-1
MIPATPEAFRLMMEGSAAFADIEERGMRIDTAYLQEAIEWTQSKISQLDDELRADDFFVLWQKQYGAAADFGKRQQLADLLYNHLGYEIKVKTKAGTGKTDVDAFEHIDLPFLGKWTDHEKLKRLLATDLLGVQRETDHKGYLHPFFHQHLAKTYRSSSSDPNFQNKPNRDKRLAKIIRRAFIPRTPEHLIVEIDYGALEFRGAASFWRDPKMIAYASDPALDIHRDMAAECYKLRTDQVTKDVRSFAKNKFVFPELYGSWYKNIGQGLWDVINQANLKTDKGVCLYEHLKSKGVGTVERFINHIKTVEENFATRFSHWDKQKDKWWDAYTKAGEFPLLTGFVCRGVYSYNFLMNSPIQGSSFHLLLWSLIETNKWLMKYNMKSCVIGQVHDSMLLDLHESEIDDVLNKVVSIMTKEVRQHWDWVRTPLEAEVEVSPDNWFTKVPWDVKAGSWKAA